VNPADSPASRPAISRALLACGALIGLAAFSLAETAATGIDWPYRVIGAIVIGASTIVIVLSTVARPLQAELAELDLARSEAGAALDRSRRRELLIRQAANAIALAGDEGEVLSTLGRAGAALWPDRDTQLLLASTDGTTATWRVAVSADGVGEPVVISADGRCRALTSGRTAVAASIKQLDSCPHVGSEADVSTVCVAVLVDGAPLASMTSIGPAGDLPPSGEITEVESLAAAATDRLRILRHERAAGSTDVIDPLTGLPNHMTVDREMRHLVSDLVPFSLAACDIDHLALYNQAYGQNNGDRALGFFAAALRDTVRPGDIVCRYGDDLFVVLFPRCSALNAQAAMERVREALVLNLSVAELAPFTVSVGVTESNQAASIPEIIENADLALSVAKHEGGNRVRLSSFDSAE